MSTPRSWVVGTNATEPIGSGVTDGMVGRVTDPLTGAGVFNANLNPATVGIDSPTGADAPAGTDMSFGSAIRRQMHTNVINGDFSALPPGGAGSVIVSDPSSADYNPLPGWVWTPDTTGVLTGAVTADTAYGSGNKLTFTASGAGAATGYLSQLVPVPTSQGQQYRVLPSTFCTVSAFVAQALLYQFLKVDLTAIGSELTTLGITGETKVDAGLVPTNAAFIKLRIKAQAAGAAGTGVIGEVRCAFLPAEATVGLAALSANAGAITSTQTVVKALTIPAGTFTVGSTYRVRAFGIITSSAANVCTFRVRVGPTTLTGTIPASAAPTATTTAAANPFSLEALVTIQTVGAGGTAQGGMNVWGTDAAGALQPFAEGSKTGAQAATVAVDTTVANLLELTAVAAAGTTSVTFTVCTIECILAS